MHLRVCAREGVLACAADGPGCVLPTEVQVSLPCLLKSPSGEQHSTSEVYGVRGAETCLSYSWRGCGDTAETVQGHPVCAPGHERAGFPSWEGVVSSASGGTKGHRDLS